MLPDNHFFAACGRQQVRARLVTRGRGARRRGEGRQGRRQGTRREERRTREGIAVIAVVVAIVVVIAIVVVVVALRRPWLLDEHLVFLAAQRADQHAAARRRWCILTGRGGGARDWGRVQPTHSEGTARTATAIQIVDRPICVLTSFLRHQSNTVRIR